MRIGMLWFDESKESFEERVIRAASFYRKKYGKEPTFCFANPKTNGAVEGTLEGLEVRTERTIMPDYFLIGVAEEVRHPN
ncbi:MAG: hypothetical protein JXA25_08515 [Anaerolineales bacterium]|nr:hypothetical protein [Anaerolineales bacterium]